MDHERSLLRLFRDWSQNRSVLERISQILWDIVLTKVIVDKGLSVIVIERGEGVETSAIKTSYSPAAGTTYITFDNVKVPVENLLGVENKGIYVILANFNHERWMMACAVIRSSRVVTEECMKWANQRIVFGKKLIEQPVIRQKYIRLTRSFEERY